MKCLVDAQLPELLCEVFKGFGIEAIHVNALPAGDETSDNLITEFADKNGLIAVTKDVDFYHGHKLYGKPQKLFLVTTGNIKNRDLFDLFRKKYENDYSIG